MSDHLNEYLKRTTDGSGEPTLVDLPEFISPRQLAKILGLGVNPIYRALTQGDIRGIKMGRNWRVPRVETLKVLKEGYTVTHPGEEPEGAIMSDSGSGRDSSFRKDRAEYEANLLIDEDELHG